ncbi:MAG: aminotransferase class I/II-fold pyridoxal phosphate-dependent enzyme [Acidobacteria bacterium]|nr:aminotransferase class I/II-fold pyridoxal phosphate-dependent enzyme [Acidobacteriota bacterium]
MNNHSDSWACIHAGEDRRGRNTPLTEPIAQTSVFALSGIEELRRIAEGQSASYLYTRYANPTTRVAEQKLAALEHADDCLVTASGQAATLCAVLAVCVAGDEIVSMLDLYGGTLKLFEDGLRRFGIRTRFVPFGELGNIERYFSERTRVLFLETPTNPTLRCVDLEALAAIARRRGMVTIVDNTFATPILQKPLDLGCDLVVHSATKYLGGHNDITAGALCGSALAVAAARELMKQLGACLDPFASYLLIRGLKTLEVRMQRASENAGAIAGALQQHARVARVLYPGLASNDGHACAQKQMRGFGAMVSFEIRGGTPEVERFAQALETWTLAASLGGVESTFSYPLLSSHVGLTEARLRELDVSPATIRLSVGIENAAELIGDLRQALDRT